MDKARMRSDLFRRLVPFLRVQIVIDAWLSLIQNMKSEGMAVSGMEKAMTWEIICSHSAGQTFMYFFYTLLTYTQWPSLNLAASCIALCKVLLFTSILAFTLNHNWFPITTSIDVQWEIEKRIIVGLENRIINGWEHYFFYYLNQSRVLGKTY